MEVVLLRHGQTAGNRAGRYSGSTDEPLCPEGVAHARTLHADGGTARVYVSPLKRTQQTAAILFPNAEQVIVPDLREMSFGVFEGRTAGEMEFDAAYRAWVDGGCTGVCPGGESAEQVAKRVCAAFAGALADAAAHKQTRAVFVLHGGAIMALMYVCARPSRSFYEWNVQNCCGYRFTVSRMDERGLPVPEHIKECEGAPKAEG